MRVGSAGVLVFSVLAVSLLGIAETTPSTTERTYPYPESEVKAALQQLGAYAGARLPALEGFVSPDTAELQRFERPYYQLQVELSGTTPESTRVKLAATISAWYNDPESSRSGYQTLRSNGRLEIDMLDRLDDYLKKGGSSQSAAASLNITALQHQIAALRAERAALEGRKAELQEEIQQKKTADAIMAKPPTLVTPKGSKALVLDSPGDVSSIFFKAETEDEFEVIEERGEWARVRLGPHSSGWVRRAQLAPVQSKAASASPASQPAASPDAFTVSRQDIYPFAGEWVSLKGKQAKFVFVRPLAVLPETALRPRKLAYAKRVFKENYLTALRSGETFDGIVVIFLDPSGGVAASTVEDIRQWIDHRLSDSAFLKRCSLDPPERFREPSP